MKRENSLWKSLLFFFLGALVCYFFCQFDFLQIDPKVNIPTSLISISTAIVGIYIGTSLKKSQTRSSNLHGYLQTKVDKCWESFSTLSQQLLIKDQDELSQITKSFKEITQQLSSVKKMFRSFRIDENCINDIETNIDHLESLLMNESQIVDNILNYTKIKDRISTSIEDIHSSFAKTFITVNQITT